MPGEPTTKLPFWNISDETKQRIRKRMLPICGISWFIFVVLLIVTGIMTLVRSAILVSAEECKDMETKCIITQSYNIYRWTPVGKELSCEYNGTKVLLHNATKTVTCYYDPDKSECPSTECKYSDHDIENARFVLSIVAPIAALSLACCCVTGYISHVLKIKQDYQSGYN